MTVHIRHYIAFLTFVTFILMIPNNPLAVKVFVFLVCLTPLWRAVYRVLGETEVNPVEFITRSSGTWALVFLLLTLSVTPIRKFTGINSLIKIRRMLGLFAFFYACLHFLIYLWLDQAWDFSEILKDIVKRPFITLGFLGFMIMCPLAITSTDAMRRRLKRNWTRLHQAIYIIAPLGLIHYFWLVKRDLEEPLIYGVILIILLGTRIIYKKKIGPPQEPEKSFNKIS